MIIFQNDNRWIIDDDNILQPSNHHKELGWNTLTLVTSLQSQK